MTELRVAAGVFAIGFLVFTLLLKVAVPVLLGELRFVPSAPPAAPHPGVAPAFSRPSMNSGRR